MILAGRAATKSWRRNFDEPRDIDLLMRSRWTTVRGRAVRGSDEPVEATRLLDAYLTRFPKAARVLPLDPADRVREVVLVHCTPRPTSSGRPAA